MEICTFISHLLLAIDASVNILLYCSVDRRFFVVVQKTLKSWFVWPFTTNSSADGAVAEDSSCESRNNKEVLRLHPLHGPVTVAGEVSPGEGGSDGVCGEGARLAVVENQCNEETVEVKMEENVVVAQANSFV